jgi:transcriptional regulator with XRE-family HTH domain
MVDRNLLGERLHMIRRRRGFTLKELARRAGTSYVGISKLEHGQKPQVSLDVVARLAEVLDVSLDYLVGRKDDEAVHLEDSELTPCNHNTSYQAALRVFAIFTLPLCSTWFVMTRSRNACCSCKILQGLPGTIA